jgi:hypothetical protein
MLDASNNVGIEVNAEKLGIYLHLVNQDYNESIANKTFENMV